MCSREQAQRRENRNNASLGSIDLDDINSADLEFSAESEKKPTFEKTEEELVVDEIVSLPKPEQLEFTNELFIVMRYETRKRAYQSLLELQLRDTNDDS